MKTEMRRALAHQSFEEKIRKVGQLIQLAAAMKAQRVREVDEHEARIEQLEQSREGSTRWGA